MQKTAFFIGLCIVGAIATASSAAEVVTLGDSVAKPMQPQAAVGSDGTIYVAFGSGTSIYCTVSRDRGGSFETAVKVADVPKLALGMRRGPRVAVAGDAVVIAAISHESGQLSTWRSSDAGKTWSEPVTVNDEVKSAREGLHALAAGPKGALYCVWLDDRSGRKELYGSGSRDGGKTWSANQLIYHSPSGSICECCHPSVAFDEKGDVYVMWRNSLKGYRDMYAGVSHDGGKTFTATKLGTGTWQLSGCPMDGGAIAVKKPGKVTTVWRREDHVFRTDTGQAREQLLGEGVQPSVATTGQGAYVAWVSKRGGDLWLTSPTMKKPVKLASDAADPMLAAPLEGAGPVVAVWESWAKDEKTLSAAVVGN